MDTSRSIFAARRRGSVIVVVLVTLLLASLMIVKFMESSAVELTLATRQADRERLREDAYAALETLLAVMAEIKAVDDDALHDPGQGWNDPYGYAGEAPREGVSVEYSLVDESGRASLPKMSFEEMAELAQVLGLGEIDAKRFADALFTWMQEDHLAQDVEAEASRYEREDPPITVPKRSLRSWNELRSVRVARDYVYGEDGALTAFGSALHENVSLYAFEGSNVNSLAPALGTARGWDATQVQQLAGFRAGKTGRKPGAPPWFRAIDDVTAVIGANVDVKGLGADIKLLRVAVTVREGPGSMRLETLVALAEGVELPAVSAGSVVPGTPAATAAAAQPAQPATEQTPPGGRAGRARRRGQGASATPTAGAAGGQGGTQSEEKLNYPFTILELVETSAPPPVVTADSEEKNTSP
jgi:general secretion pathway protein K